MLLEALRYSCLSKSKQIIDVFLVSNETLYSMIIHGYNETLL